MWKSRGEDAKKFYDFKTKKRGCKVQVSVLANQMINGVSMMKRATRHDKRHLEKSNMINDLYESDEVCMGKGGGGGG